LLEAYLRAVPVYRQELYKQVSLEKQLTTVALAVKDSRSQDILLRDLAKVTHASSYQLPLSPAMVCSGLKLEKAKFMDSKKLPLWLVFENAESKYAPPILVLFKVGDDVRQDMLTLQMMKLMDRLWKNAALDLQMSVYGCVATGDERGMIEIVQNAETLGTIFKLAGGSTAVFKADPISNWLRQYNATPEQWDKCVDSFVRSTAGYSVAMYVLGVGDRHSDNLMLVRSGRLLHIDFGHFLGNYKKKFNIKRERAPFVLTGAFAHVMGGVDSPGWQKFVDLCCRAYAVLRKNASLFMNLFAMMLSTGIPELRSVDDLRYLSTAFALHLNETQAREHFCKLIIESINCKTTLSNMFAHQLAH